MMFKSQNLFCQFFTEDAMFGLLPDLQIYIQCRSLEEDVNHIRGFNKQAVTSSSRNDVTSLVCLSVRLFFSVHLCTFATHIICNVSNLQHKQFETHAVLITRNSKQVQYE